MAITVKILADSISPLGKRLTTREWRYPRNIHSEIMTHKMFSKNSASSRAIPPEKLIQSIIDDPFVPKYIGANQKGMQAGEELSAEQKIVARELWLSGRDNAVTTAKQLMALGIHKQVVNRIIEPWMWITIIISATENANLWGLRCHKDAEPHFQELAYLDRALVEASMPRVLQEGEWHLPLVDFDDEIDRSLTPADLIKVAVGRCARVSYLTHEGKREPAKDVELHDKLMVQSPLHASPAEHVAQSMDYPRWFKNTLGGFELPLDVLQNRVLTTRRSNTFEGTLVQLREEAALAQMRSGNFLGWRQYRKTLPNENIGGMMP